MLEAAAANSWNCEIFTIRFFPQKLGNLGRKGSFLHLVWDLEVSLPREELHFSRPKPGRQATLCLQHGESRARLHCQRPNLVLLVRKVYDRGVRMMHFDAPNTTN